ncbi:MAG: response regulator [Cyanobacteria bacterium J055]|nr:MAG: response regulator [Cyanobacteria bacterium J055]
MRILFVEDDEALASVVSDALRQQNYVVDFATDGEEGWNYAGVFTYDLMLLDVSLPKLDGISLCRRLREAGHNNPIVLLTANDDSADKVRGLDAGADDYVVKPCTIEELLARIRALRRRQTAPGAPILEWGGLRLNPSFCEVTYDGNLIHLTPKEYSLLELFMRHPRHVFSRSAILEHLWSFNDPPGEETIRAHIKGLRRKLKEGGAREAIETVYGIGYRLKALPEPEVEETPEQQTQAAISQAWERYKPSVLKRMEIVGEALQALENRSLSESLRGSAERESHKLAGSLGMFGFPNGSQLARDLERSFVQLGEKLPAEPPQIDRLQGLVSQLQHLLENDPTWDDWAIAGAIVEPTANGTGNGRSTLKESADSSTDRSDPRQTQNPLLLVVDDDAELAEELRSCALSWEIQVEVASSLERARSMLTQIEPDVVLLDLNFPEAPDDGLVLLEEITARFPRIPVLVFTVRDGFDDRVAVARLGGRAFLPKPIPPHHVLESVREILQRNRTATRPRILAVDDDPLLLKVIARFLQPWGIELRTLEDPRKFWETLEATVPDLLILDVQMPYSSGIDLCQVVRNDNTWNELPILFLSADHDAATIHRLYQAGADDYIAKPVTEPELVTRIFNRLERVQLLRAIAETDPLTGVANRTQSTKELHRYLRLANTYQQPMCLVVLNVDEFRTINDRMGHDTGDRVLHRLGMSLRQKFRSDDVVARWGGEEFIIGMYGMNQQDGMRRLTEIIEQIRSDVLLVRGHPPLQISFSGGVAEYPSHGTDLPALYRAAAKALTHAKTAGGDRLLNARLPSVSATER